jgi:hypothetical protein
VAQRRLEPLEDIPVHLRSASADLKCDFLSQPPGDIPHHARKPLHAIVERAHPAGDRFAIQAIGEHVPALIDLASYCSRILHHAFGHV